MHISAGGAFLDGARMHAESMESQRWIQASASSNQFDGSETFLLIWGFINSVHRSAKNSSVRR